ncbi:MAG: hypothetical protein ACXADL_00565 [Candidatus Thorarchaeota archaeon]
MGQVIGTIAGLLTAFAITFIILTFGLSIPEDVISGTVVNDFLAHADLEAKLAIVGTVLYQSSMAQNIGDILGYGANGSSVLMFLAWGTGGLVAGLLAREVVPAILAAIFSVIIGAFLIWLLIFFINTTDFMALFGSPSLSIMERVLMGSLYPGIAAFVGGLLGGGISRRR